MAPLDIDTALDWRGRTVVDRDGDKIGTFDELYLDEDDRPAWGAVTTGLFGMRQTFVPLSEAQPDGDALRVPFGKDMVKDAPNVDPDTQLDPEEEALLYRHYGLAGGRGGAAGDARDDAVAERGDDTVVRGDDDAVARGGDDAVTRRDDDAVARRDDDTVVREDDDGLAPDQAAPATAAGGDGEGAEMIRSEEEVQVGTRRRVAGKARLKKYVVTEHVQKVVPVQREEVRVEFEPPSGDEAVEGDAPVEPGRDAPAERRPVD
jgi:stress response protein YsnF